MNSNIPVYSNGKPFLGFRLPAAQIFTDYSPSNDINAYIQAITGLEGGQQRKLLQSPHGTELLGLAAKYQLADSLSNLAYSGYQSRASCQRDSDCGSDQVCFTFNNRTYGSQQGPTCSDVVYPEIELGNKYNNGKPLRQSSDSCKTEQDCKGIDKFSKKPKKSMTCDHYYRGETYEDYGMCEVHYENKGRIYTLKQPPGWSLPLQEELQKCESDPDCGPTGINGWVRCKKAGDGNSYCVWPGQTDTQNPRDLISESPVGLSKIR
jgi:hypothetical protein